MNHFVEIKVVNPVLTKEYDLPKYVTSGSAGLDVRACISEPVVVEPQQVIVIPTGFSINIGRSDIMAMIVPRSGLGFRGLVLGNLTGIIDSDFQGEIKISVWNRTIDSTFTIEPFERICQMIFVPVLQVSLKLVNEFSLTTERCQNGFGHSGTK
ncbi:MAG: dUTP diphosphatase [Oligoflexales bacterium]|nr:dUTP diphosphatase [Oligoflexales bacterium]